MMGLWDLDLDLVYKVFFFPFFWYVGKVLFVWGWCESLIYPVRCYHLRVAVDLYFALLAVSKQ